MQEESICSYSISHMQKDKEDRLLGMGCICDLTLDLGVQNSSEYGSRESEVFA